MHALIAELILKDSLDGFGLACRPAPAATAPLPDSFDRQARPKSYGPVRHSVDRTA